MAQLPAQTDLQRIEAQRATRQLRAVAAEIDRTLSDRSFRFWALLTLNVLDLLTTSVVLALGGSESNPAMMGVVEHWWRPIAVKAVVLALMWLAVLRAPARSRTTDVVLAMAWIFYAGVVGWNTLLLIRY